MRRHRLSADIYHQVADGRWLRVGDIRGGHYADAAAAAMEANFRGTAVKFVIHKEGEPTADEVVLNSLKDSFAWLEKMQKQALEEECATGCPGWFINQEKLTIEKCDTCGIFETDDEAAEHVLDIEKAEVTSMQKHTLVGLTHYLITALELQCHTMSDEVRQHNAGLYLTEAREVLDAVR